MASKLKKWRESATILVVVKNALLPSKPVESTNYKLLTLKRSLKSHFMPNANVFPGGTVDKADCCRDWLKLYKKFGINESSFETFKRLKYSPPIFENTDENILPKFISLRICAIRETFEECGFLLCKYRHSHEHSESGWGTFFELPDMMEWQKRVHKDPTKFIELCDKFEIYPDIWALYEWSNWLTPSSMRSRFDTIFFLTALQNIPATIVEEKEVQSIEWQTPYDYLKENKNGKIFLPPPQFYEMSRLLNFSDIDDLVMFIQSLNGLQRFLPYRIATDKSEATILPGDDLYPGETEAEIPNTDVFDEIPKNEVMHRMLHPTTFENHIVTTNYKPFIKHVIPLLFENIKEAKL